MEFPDRDVALAWVGRTLIDRDGAEIGACTAVFSDDATGLTEWVCSEFGGPAVFIPAVGAAEAGGQVQVAVSRAEVASAPSVGGEQHISEEEEAALYRHYGVPHSRDASPTLLPTEEAQPSTDEVASDAATAEAVQTATAAEPAAAEPAAAEPLAAPAHAEPATAEPVAVGNVAAPTAAEPVAAPGAAEEAAPRTESASDAGQGESGTQAPPARGARRVAPVVGGLAGVGLALGVALRVRRLRTRRPPTRRERLAQRGRAASAAVGARAGQIAASAAPLLQSARRPGRTGAVASVPAAAALLLAALRRRRSASRTAEEDRSQPVLQALPVPAADPAPNRRPAAPQPPPSTP